MKKLAIITLVFTLIFSFFCVAFAEEANCLVTTGKVNVRELPDIDAKIIGNLDEGVTVHPINRISTYDGRTWVQVEWNGKDGYISDKYLEGDYEDVIYNVSVQMITTGDVNVRVDYSMDAKIRCVIEEGTIVDVWTFYSSDDGRIWAEIETDDGECGYISNKYLDFVEDGPMLKRNMLVKGDVVLVRANASLDAEVVNTVNGRDVVTVHMYLPTDDGLIWALCSMDGEEIGFISTDCLRAVTVVE